MKSTAHVITDRPARYGKQLTSHFAAKASGWWEGTTGRIEFPPTERNDYQSARVNLVATDTLNLTIETTHAAIAHMERVVARHLVAFGRKDELRVEFTREDGTPGTTFGPEDLPQH